jgi:hypothetical protein
MSQRQVAVNRQRREETVRAKVLLAPCTRNTGRFWEWDCFVKYPIIKIARQNSSQFDKFRHILCNYYTLAQGSGRRNRARLCPILGMGLFHKILADWYISTQFIKIQHIPADFVPVIDAPYANR